MLERVRLFGGEGKKGGDEEIDAYWMLFVMQWDHWGP